MRKDDAESPGEVIREAREARDWTQADLARRAGTSQQNIDRIEKGIVKHSKALPRIALELSLNLEKLIPDLARKPASDAQRPIPETELKTGPADFPVHAAAQGGSGELIVSTDPVAWVVRPSPLVGVSRAYGIIVVGDSMIPEFWPGDTALIHPHLPPERGEPFVFYAEGDGEVRATIKHLVRWSETLWYVRQWNPLKGQKPDFALSRREWTKCHRVVGKYSK